MGETGSKFEVIVVEDGGTGPSNYAAASYLQTKFILMQAPEKELFALIPSRPRLFPGEDPEACRRTALASLKRRL